MPTISELFASKLADAGIDIVFGLPGGESVPILAALRQQGIEFVLVHNEATAVYMADSYARLTGKPGVCLTTLGPGATNAMAGLGHAYLDRAPIIFFTARMWHELADSHTHQTIDQTAVFAPITKATFDLRPDNAANAIDEALYLTLAGRPGPVHLQVSKQVATQEAIAPAQPFVPPTPSAPLPMSELEKARLLLQEAERPVMIVGLGLEPERPYSELAGLVEAVETAVILTPKAKGAISAASPYYVGTLGITRTDPAYEILEQADCIIAVGFDIVELVKPWDETAPLVWIAPWENEDVPIPAVAQLVGKMAPALNYLTDLPSKDRSAWQKTIADFKARQAARKLPEPAAGRMLPQAVLEAIHANVPDNTLVTTDVGSHKILTALEWPSSTPNRYQLSNGLSSMGFGLPAAIAASLVLNKQPTVSIMGDGGFSMIIGELELITRLQTPVITVVMNDNALDLIRAAQWRSGHDSFGTEFGNPDFMLIAQAYGIAGRRVTTLDECAEAVREAIAASLKGKRPFLIEAMIDPVSYPTTPKRET
ncbi:MAG: thiamine pyrophosphate-binding protein [Chloroflexota bacterium]